MGVSLGEAAESTKVLKEYLQAFEKGDFKLEVPEVYKRGFLLLYVRYLKLDEEAIMAAYDSWLSPSPFGDRKEGSSLFAVEEESAKPPKALARQDGESSLLKFQNKNQVLLGALVVLGVFLLAGSLVFVLRPDTPDTPNLIEDLVERGDSDPVSPVLEPLIPENAISVAASGNCEDVLVEQLEDDQLLFRGPLQKGQRLVLERKGNVVVKSKSIGLISVTIGSKTFTNNTTGPGAWYFNLEEPYNP